MEQEVHNNKFINWSQIFRDIIVNVTVIGVAGAFMTHCYQVKESKREEAQKIMNTTSTLIMKRMYELERVVFALDRGSLSDAKIYFKKYEDDAIPEWNINFPIYYQEIKSYYGQSLADKFTRVEEISPPGTLFYDFRNAHSSTLKWTLCMQHNEFAQSGKGTCDLQKKYAHDNLDKLKSSGISYIKDLNDAYQQYYH